MQLSNMMNIRKRKRISRREMAEDLDMTEAYIKKLETEEMNISRDEIETIACYLDVEVIDLFIDTSDIFQQIINNPLVKKINIKVPEDVNPQKALDLLEGMLSKRKINNDIEAERFLAEYKYRLGELSEKDEEYNLFEDIDEKDDEFITEINTKSFNEVIKHIQMDAKLAAEAYKVLRNEDLSVSECLQILKIIIE